MRAVRVSATGGPSALTLVTVDDPNPGPGQVVVDVAAAGVNFLDTYHRTGLYAMPLPFTPGLEGAGTVTAVGDGVASWQPGDRVAWSGQVGSYAQLLLADPQRLVAVPDDIELDVAAAALLQGMTAHYLVHDTFPLSPGDRCLVHAGAGGVGLLLVQFAKHLGAEVFTTVGSEDKAELVEAAGADHVIRYREVDFVAAIEQIAGPRPLDVVFDGVGAATFAGGLRLLRRRGTMATFGNASGPVEPISPLVLSQNGSLFLTRPTLFDHVVERADLERRAGDVFELIREGRLDVRIGHRLPLADAAAAHEMLEGRRTTGKILLVP